MPLKHYEKRAKQINRWHEKFKRATIGQIFNGFKSNPPFGIANNFQLVVRLENAFDDGGVWKCNCISCGRPHRWEKMNGGHFISRQNWAVIVDPRNVHPQCIWCNHHQSGNIPDYRAALVEKIGIREVEDLEKTRLSKDHIWIREDLAVIKVDFLERIKIQKKRLGIR